MSRTIRTILTTVFAIAFFVTAPILVLYSAGYRYQSLKHRIQKTGIIRVETVPAGARVWINGELQEKTTPAAYSRLLPEDYEVRMELKGYLPWKEELEVHSGETTFATGVRMIRDELPRLVTADAAREARWHDGTGRMAYVRVDGSSEAGANEIVVRDAAGAETLLARFAPNAYASIALSWSPDGRTLLATGALANGSTHLFALGAETGRASSRSLHDAFISGPLSAHWTEDGRIAIAARDGIYEASVGGTVTAKASGRGYVDAASDGRAWYAIVETAERSTVTRLDQRTPSVVATLPKGPWRFIDGSVEPLIAVDESHGRLAVISRPGEPPTMLDATRIERDTDGASLLTWNDFEIATLDLTTDEREIVTRIGATIFGATRTTDGSVIFSTPSGIALIQRHTDGYRDAVDLVRFTDIGPFHVSPDGDMLRFFGAVGSKNGLYERDL